MARFRDLHFYPYSGWHRQRWGQPETSSRAVDAAARSARRVTEAISRLLLENHLVSPVGSYRLFLTRGEGLDLRLITGSSARDMFLGRLEIPRGFQHLDPQVRAGLIADASQAALLALALAVGWDTSIVLDAVQKVRDNDFACGWTGPWKSTRDRKSRIRLEGRILDDGYGRWRIVVADQNSDEPRLVTEEILGWTWLDNFNRTAKSLRFSTATVLELSAGPDTLPEQMRIDISTGKIHKRPHYPKPTVYPGDTKRAPQTPHLLIDLTAP